MCWPRVFLAYGRAGLIQGVLVLSQDGGLQRNLFQSACAKNIIVRSKTRFEPLSFLPLRYWRKPTEWADMIQKHVRRPPLCCTGSYTPIPDTRPYGV